MSATRMMILGLVQWMQPVHGYDVRRELLSWSADKWANVQPGSIYHGLRKLAEEGLLRTVATEQVDLATDYDRNLAAMIAAGRVQADQVRVVWRSDPLPNDALAVRRGLDPAVKQALLTAALSLDAAAAARVLPTNYTGWERATPETYAGIEAAGRALGKLAAS